jgi:hypothetical protein
MAGFSPKTDFNNNSALKRVLKILPNRKVTYFCRANCKADGADCENLYGFFVLNPIKICY